MQKTHKQLVEEKDIFPEEFIELLKDMVHCDPKKRPSPQEIQEKLKDIPGFERVEIPAYPLEENLRENKVDKKETNKKAGCFGFLFCGS
jgi:hypothetical protein